MLIISSDNAGIQFLGILILQKDGATIGTYSFNQDIDKFLKYLIQILTSCHCFRDTKQHIGAFQIHFSIIQKITYRTWIRLTRIGWIVNLCFIPHICHV